MNYRVSETEYVPNSMVKSAFKTPARMNAPMPLNAMTILPETKPNTLIIIAKPMIIYSTGPVMMAAMLDTVLPTARIMPLPAAFPVDDVVSAAEENSFVVIEKFPSRTSADAVDVDVHTRLHKSMSDHKNLPQRPRKEGREEGDRLFPGNGNANAKGVAILMP